MALTDLALESLQGMLTQVLIAALVLLVGLILGKLIGKLLLVMLDEFDLDTAIKNMIGIDMAIAQILATLITYVTYFVFFVFAVSVLGITTYVFDRIGYLILIVTVLYMILAFKDAVPNGIAGIVLRLQKTIQHGQTITAENHKGIIDTFGLTETTIVTKNKDTIVIPNILLLKHPIIVHKKGETNDRSGKESAKSTTKKRSK